MKTPASNVRVARRAGRDQLATGVAVVAAGLALAAAFGLALSAAAADRDGKTGPSATQQLPPRDPQLARIAASIDEGYFAKAETLIDAAIASSASDAERRRALEFERERMRRIVLDFPHDREAVKARVKQDIPDLTDAEFDAWDRAGLFEKMTIDGRVVYFDRAATNLFRLDKAALARRDPKLPPLREGPLEQPHPHHEAVIRGSATGNPLTQRVRITQSIRVEPDAVPAGKTVRAWIPYPRAIDGHQTGIQTVATEPAKHHLAPASTLQRTVYFEKPAVAGTPTEFSVTYDLTIAGQHHAIDLDKVTATPQDPALSPFLAEQWPHIVFTPEIRAFSKRVVGDEKRPGHVARKLFAAVDEIPWAGAREYSTLSNIPNYVLDAKHADCGQQTLLLVTLLRLNGIPARWQSGWVFSDSDYDTMHDWGLAYLAPYGWVPVDVTFGRLAAAASPKLEWFYFGGLDAWRVAYNDDISTPFDPPKKHFRSETVDSQRGEVEWDGGNLYFDRWDYNFRWELAPNAGSPAATH